MKRPGGFDGSFDGEEPLDEIDRASDEPVFGTAHRALSEPAAVGDGPDDQETDRYDRELAGAERSGSALDTPRQRRAGALARFRGAGDPVREAERRVRRAQRMRRIRDRQEQRRFSADTRRKRRRWMVGIGAVALLAIFVAVCAFTPLTAVRTVAIEGASAVPEEELVDALERFDGVPLALVDDRGVHQALEAFPLIQRYHVERIPPHTLAVTITERVAVIAVKAGETFDLYDAAAVKIGRAEAPPEGVPLAEGSVTDLSSPSFAAAAAVVRDIPGELRAQVRSVTATSRQDVALTLDGGLEVVWGEPTDTARKATVLQTMLEALGDRPVSYVDVSSVEAPVFR